MTDEAEARIEEIIKGAELYGASDNSDRNPTQPRVLVDKRNPHRTVAALRDVIAERGSLYDRGIPVRLVRDRMHGGMQARPVTADAVVLLAHQICRPYVKRVGNDATADADAAFPLRMASMYLDWIGEWQLPVLNGIASAPILGESGSIRSTSGYDAGTGFWLERVPDVAPLVPFRPTRSDAEQALLRIRHQFRTICFGDAPLTVEAGLFEAVVDRSLAPGKDESSFLVALLTAICRPSLPLAPAILIRAPSMSGAGSGKGLLARCLSLVAFGREPFAVTSGGSSQELEKRIASELVAGGPTLFLDNINDRALRSDLLASAITERAARVRVLGKSEMVSLNASMLVMLTGNGLTVAEDLARRFIVIELDPKAEDPEARVFTFDLQADVIQRRKQLLADNLTIWRWGRLLGNALESGRALGSFGAWSRWVRDPLLALGCCDPVLRTSESKERDARRQERARTYMLWARHHGSRPVTADKLHEEIKAALDPQARGRQFLASEVERLTGVRIAGMVMTRQKGGHWSAATYALITSDERSMHREHGGHRPEPEGSEDA
jgi:hypothetical protein